MFRAFICATFLFLLIGCALGLRALANNPIEKIIIKGDLTLLERNLLQEKFRRDFEAGIMDFGLFEKINAIRKRFNWVYSIEIARDWPSSLVLSVRKILPVAKWNDGRYLSSQAQIIDSVLDYDELPIFKVANSSPIKSMRVYRDLAGKLAHNNWDIRELNENTHGEWSITMSNGLVVRLGRDGLNRSLRRSIMAYAGLAPKYRSSIEYIDARYLGGVALKTFADNKKVNHVAFTTNH